MHRVPTALSARIMGKGGQGLESSVLLFRTASASARSLSPPAAAAVAVPANNNGLRPTSNAASNRRRLSLAAPVIAPVVIVGTGGRSFSSSTQASLLGDDGFDPFTTHHNSEDADRADRMVRDLVKRRLASGVAVKIREDFLGGALNSYRVLSEKAAEQARRGKRRPDASFARKADDLLAFVEQASEQDHTLSPDIKSYNMVVNAFANIGDPEGAEAVSQRLEKLWEAGNAKLKPDTILYGAVIDAWARSREKGAARRAEAILEHMEQLHQQGHEDIRPNTICYSAVINAWAKSREKGAAQRAEAILNHMLKLHEGGREGCCPNMTSFNTVIDAWARSRDKDAPKRAEALLERMETLHGQGYENVCSNVISYNAVINAWAKSRESSAALRAEVILDHMLKLHQVGREGCCPDTASFNTVIDAWAKSGDKDAPRRAEVLLGKMETLYGQGYEDVRPDVISFNAVINAWAKSREKGAAQRAGAILNHMLKLHESGREGCCPDRISFTAVIDAWAKSGDNKAHEHAKRVFRQMQEMGDAAEPNVLTYTSLINVLAVSSVPDKAAKAFDMLLETEMMASQGNKDVAPTIFTYGSVMKACARTSGNQESKRNALRVALGVFDKLRRTPHLTATPLIYDPLFTAIANASKGQEYIKLVSEVFKLCCKDGALDDWILQNVRRRAPKDVLGKLVGHTGKVGVSDLPREWSRNTKARQ